MRLPAGYASRPVTMDDLEAVVVLHADHDLALVGDVEPTREFLGWFWSLRSVDLARDTVMISAGEDVAAYADAMWDPAAGGPVGASARVHPAHRGRGLGSALAEWCERLADGRGADGLRTDVLAADRPAAELLRSRGYVHVRSSWTMGRTIAGSEVAGDPPDGVSFRVFRSGDERILFEVHESSFADHWGFRPTTFESFSDMWFGPDDFDPSLVLLAELDGRAVGHIASLLNEAGGYVYSLGVVRDARGRGIAQALLRGTFALLAERGQRDVTLAVDAANPTGAVELYRKVGMEVRRQYDQYDLGTDAAAHLAAEDGSARG